MTVRTIVQLTMMDETGDSYYRMRWPARDLAAQTGWRVVNLDARASDRHEWMRHADVAVLYQSNDPSLLPLIEERRTRGLKTIVEYNDNFYAPPEWSPVAAEWSSPLLWQTYERFMELADALVVTGPGLEELFGRVVQGRVPLLALPNHLPFAPRPLAELSKEKPSHLTAGWGGSFGHLADLLGTLPMLRELLAELPELELMLMGNEALPELTNLPKSRCAFTPWGPMEKYFEFLRPLKLGLIPLLDTPYNRCRSDVKALEMAAHGVVPILPDAVPYREFIAATGIPAYRGFREMKDLVKRFATDPARTREALERCHAYVSAQRVGSTRRERVDLYERMMPETSPSHAWSVPAGYHEIRSSHEEKPATTKILEHAQQLIRDAKLREAAELLRKAHLENRHVPDIALGELKIRIRLRDAEMVARAKEYRERFPRDPRFLLAGALCQPRTELQLACWRELTALVAGQPPAYGRFFQGDIEESYIGAVTKNLELVPVLEDLLRLYPASLRFHSLVAEIARETGEASRAAVHFETLHEQIVHTETNRQFFEKSDRTLIAMWAAALAAQAEYLRSASPVPSEEPSSVALPEADEP